MRIFGIGLIAIALSFRAFAQQPAVATPVPVALPSVALPPELDRVLRDYERAWQNHDANALSELFAEDGFVLAGGRPPVRGREAIRIAYAGAGGPLSLRAFAFATAGSIGYVIGGFGPAPTSPDGGKFVLTLKRSGAGRWQIMSDMDNSNRPWQPRPTESVTHRRLCRLPFRSEESRPGG